MLKRINNIKVGRVQTGRGEDYGKPVRGGEIFPDPYSNIFLLAKKKSGKTTLLATILKKCVGPKTKLIFMVSTIDRDDIYKHLVEYYEGKGNEVVAYKTITEGSGKKRISHISEELKALDPEEEEDEDDEEESQTPICDFINFGTPEPCDISEPITPKKREVKDKYISPELIFILDDQGTLLRDVTVSNLVKDHRHYKSKVIISSQYVHDLRPEAITQLNYIIIFGKQPEEKLKKVWEYLNLALSYETFLYRYKLATEKPYNFLYIDRDNEKYRVNFNREFID